MNPDDVPLWIDVTIGSILAGITLLACAYEAALDSASRARIMKRMEKGRVLARRFLTLAAGDDRSVWLRIDMLFVISTACAMLFAQWLLLRGGQMPGIGVIARWNAVAIFGLLVLRSSGTSLGEWYAERLVIGAALPMSLLTLPLVPFASLAMSAERVFTRIMGVQEEDEEEEREAEVIDALSDGQLDGVVQDGQKQMIEGIFDFKDSDVADIIVPRTEMTSVSADASLAEAVTLAQEKGYSRLPVWRGNRDNIVGIFYVRDCLPFWDKPPEERPPLSKLLRQPLFVPETKPVLDLLAEMRRGGSHMAVVLDEYGGTAGLVTMENVLEEIVGDIQDESDKKDNDADGVLRQMDDYTVIADGTIHVAEVNKTLGRDIIPEDDDYETVAGFVLDNLGHIPKAGESFTYENKLSVRVLLADERRVRRVRMQATEITEE